LSFIHLSDDIKAKLENREPVVERLFVKQRKVHTPNPKKCPTFEQLCPGTPTLRPCKSEKVLERLKTPFVERN